MKIGLVCTKCTGQRGEPLCDKVFVEIQEAGVYEIICPKGHKSTVVLQDLKHEILFESGAIALIDGYSREAVASFMASVERFYEFMVRVLLRVVGVQSSVLQERWKQVKSQSERQFGAIIILYLAVNGQPLPDFSEDQRGFRNKVIHQGFIPTSERAEQFAQYCLEHIYETLKRLNERGRKAVVDEFREHVRKIDSMAKGKVTAHHLRQPFIQTHLLGTEDLGKMTLREMMEVVGKVIRADGKLYGTSI